MSKENKELAWTTEKRKVDDLLPYEHNPRKMNEEQVDQLKRSLTKFNLASIPVINKDNILISGHQRMKVMKLLGRGEEMIDVRVPSRQLDEDEMKELNIRENKNLGEFDFDILANSFDLDMLLESGFKEFELGLGDNGLKDVDIDDLSKTMDSYLDGNIKQIVIYFTNEEYNTVIPRMEAILKEEGLTNHTEAFLLMLKNYEDTKSKKN